MTADYRIISIPGRDEHDAVPYYVYDAELHRQISGPHASFEAAHAAVKRLRDSDADPAAAGEQAARTDAAVARARARGDRATLTTIKNNLGAAEYRRRYSK